MKQNSEMDQLLEKILLYRAKKEYELQLLKLQFEITKDSLQPVNVLKNSLLERIVTTNAKSYLISIGIGLATNFLNNRIHSKQSNNPIRNIIASALKFIKN